MANKLEKDVRNKSLTIAKQFGFQIPTDPLKPGCPGLLKRMHFGNGTANGWPDDLIVFADGHHWWIEFKSEDGKASALQEYVHDNISRMHSDVSIIASVAEFVTEFHKRRNAHT